MTEYKQMSLFDEYIDDESEENFIEQKDGYSFYQDDTGNENEFEYKVFDKFGILISKWKSKSDCLSMATSDYKHSINRQTFFRIINQEKDKIRKAQIARASKERAAAKEIAKQKTSHSSYLYYDDDDDSDISWYGRGNGNGSYRSYSYGGYYGGGYTYKPKPKSKGFLDKLNKSDTLVVHCEDNSTDMLAQIYQGKNWDVLRDGDIDKDELHQLLQSHDRIVCLGHGTSGGLMNKQGGGYTIGAEEAPFLKNKKLFIIWCNADGYFERYNIGKGQFITGNMPSEVWECRAAGCGDISAQLMLENITYWSKLCADVTERALNGDAQGAVDYVRDKYIEKYGDHPVTIYNAERTKVQGKPLEDLSDRYWGPKELLHPAKPTYRSFSSFKQLDNKGDNPENDTPAPDDVDENVDEAFFNNSDEFEVDADGVLRRYNGSDPHVVIPNNVKNIKFCVFQHTDSLTSIVIPNSVTTIEVSAFSSCRNLVAVEFEKGSKLTSIGYSAFSNCTSLKSIVIPNSVTSIGNSAFYNCKNLVSVTFEEESRLRSIGNIAFKYCSSLTNIVIPRSVSTIGDFAFSECKSLSIFCERSSQPDSWSPYWNLTDYGWRSARPVKWDSSKAINNVVAPDDAIDDIEEEYTFEDNDYSRFHHTNVWWYGKAKNVIDGKWHKIAMKIIDEVDFEEAYNDMEYNIPFPFSDFKLFGHILSKPEGYEEIEEETKKYTNDNINEALNEYFFKDIDNFIITANGVLKKYKGNDSHVNIPKNVTSIRENAFSNCKSLITINIPNSITSIGDSAFIKCTSLTSVVFEEDSKLTSIGECAFSDCSSLTTITIPDSVTSIKGGAFSGCKSLTSIKIPNSIISIDDYIFSDCNSLKSIIIPNNVTYIGDEAFSGCKSLNSLKIPDSVTSIGNGAFGNCESLTSVKFEENSELEHIGNYAFANCKSLTSIEIPSSVTTIGGWAFKHCRSLTIYCKLSKQPYGWKTDWKDSKVKVKWGYKEDKSKNNAVSFNKNNSNTSDIDESLDENAQEYYGVFQRGGSISNANHFIKLFTDAEKAKAYAKRMRHFLTPGEKDYYGMGYTVKKLTQYDLKDSEVQEMIKELKADECLNVNNEVLTESKEDQEKLINFAGQELADKFIKYKDRLTGQEKDLYYWLKKDVKDLEDRIAELENTKSNTQLKKTANEEGAEYLGSSNGYDVYCITTYEASRNYGRDAKWCVSMKDTSSYWDDYTKNGVEFYFFMGKDPHDKYALAVFTNPTYYDPDFYDEDDDYEDDDYEDDYDDDDGYYLLTDPDTNEAYPFELYNSNDNLVYDSSEEGNVSDFKKLPISLIFNRTDKPKRNPPKFIIKDNCLVRPIDKNIAGDIIIPNNVTSIGEKAFKDCKSLTSVTFEENSKLENIGEDAFYDCSSLTSIKIPNSVTSIGKSAFRDCYSLSSIIIPTRVTNIEWGAFSYCSSLTSITIPNNVTSIGNDAFYGCKSLTSINIPNSVLSIGNDAFQGCSSLKYNEYGNCLYLGNEENPYLVLVKAKNELITEATISNSTRFIMDEVFKDCYSLSSIIIPKNITSILNNSFWYCGLSTIYCEASSKPSGWHGCWSHSIPVYWGVTKNDMIVVQNGAQYLIIDGKAVVVGHEANTTNVVISSTVETNGKTYNVTSIEKDAFRYRHSLTSIVIPNSITHIGVGAFEYCSSLTSVKFEEGSKLTNIEKHTFQNCHSLLSIVIPNSVTSIGYYAFKDCRSLTSVTFEKGSKLTSIDSSAFEKCSSLTSIVIPNSVTNIGSLAFKDCSSLKSIFIPNNVTNMGNAVFADCDDLTVYCEAENQPKEWDSNWRYPSYHIPIIWGFSEYSKTKNDVTASDN